MWRASPFEKNGIKKRMKMNEAINYTPDDSNDGIRGKIENENWLKQQEESVNGETQICN